MQIPLIHIQRRFILLLIGFLSCLPSLASAVRDTISLAGEWQYYLLGAPASISGEGFITLPGTLDQQHKSVYNPESDNTTQLRREFSFSGGAQYTREIEIPQNWKNKNIELYIERTKPSKVLIDGKEAGVNSRISSPQRYDLSEFLNPGVHTIDIIVNNADSIPPTVSRSSHAASESTQTNWNGILGDFILEARNKFHIENIYLNENLEENSLKIKILFSEEAKAGLILKSRLDSEKTLTRPISPGKKEMEIILPLSPQTKRWSALDPNILSLNFSVENSGNEIIDAYSLLTGIREFRANGNTFEINGHPLFLRGTLNAAVFPETAYSPLDEERWEDYFKIIKDYGFNHVRFHSWTPPEAAFNVADRMGIYLQTELPIWGELDRDMKFHNRFLKEELQGILEAYSSHPSFVLFSTGNELWGDISLMEEYMNYARTNNPRILATYGSNVYLGMNGRIGQEDFIVSAKTSDEIDNSVRGSVSFADSPSGGYFNSNYPNSKANFSHATKDIHVPVISHEVGQYQSYPDFDIIEEFTGPLKADNLKEFKKRSIEAGTYRKNKEFSKASGQWAAKLYKAEMEMAQRSAGIAGFQLFGLQDYPGQGTSLIGILDPFMQTKGFVSTREWSESNDDLMILAEFPKFSFIEGEIVEIPVLTANYTQNSDSLTTIIWEAGFKKGSIPATPGEGLIEIGSIFLPVPRVDKPMKETLTLRSEDGSVSNNYDFWVYPKNYSQIPNVTVTDNLKDALILLDQGEKVILCPDSLTSAEASIKPLFVNDFWNYRMFRTICDEMGLEPSPGTLGLYINNNHPSLSRFPTETHVDWQWFPIVANSRPLIIDRLPKDFNPIVEVIDNVERNFRLALILECNVGKGKLIILAADKDKISEYPEGRWLLQSLMEYMDSKDFKAPVTLTPEQIVNLVTKPSNARKIKELKNETYNSRWD